jgi:hypothetical protein
MKITLLAAIFARAAMLAQGTNQSTSDTDYYHVQAARQEGHDGHNHHQHDRRHEWERHLGYNSHDHEDKEAPRQSEGNNVNVVVFHDKPRRHSKANAERNRSALNSAYACAPGG